MLSRDKYRKEHLMSRYGLTLEQYDSMFDVQKGTCAICGLPEKALLYGLVKRLAVDHCHKTGKVRGLLCNSCNALLAKIGDSKEWLINAGKYLD